MLSATLRDQVSEALSSMMLRTGSQRLLVAFSGGVDSTVLLRFALDFGRQNGILTEAVYVDHGLNPASERWAQHCREVADQWSVKLSIAAVQSSPPDTASVEAWARQQRYRTTLR